MLDADFDVNRSMRRHATSLMRRRMLKTATPTHVMSSALEVRDFVERFTQDGLTIVLLANRDDLDLRALGLKLAEIASAR